MPLHISMNMSHALVYTHVYTHVDMHVRAQVCTHVRTHCGRLVDLEAPGWFDEAGALRNPETFASPAVLHFNGAAVAQLHRSFKMRIFWHAHRWHLVRNSETAAAEVPSKAAPEGTSLLPKCYSIIVHQLQTDPPCAVSPSPKCRTAGLAVPTVWHTVRRLAPTGYTDCNN